MKISIRLIKLIDCSGGSWLSLLKYWMAMTLITMTETTGIGIPTVKVILTGVEDGIVIIEVKDIVVMAEGEDGIPIKADHTATKTLIMGTGHRVTMITMTLMGSLFSNGGS